MDWAWRFGMFILTGVPAIVGGGAMWALSESWTVVGVYEVVLLIVMTLVISKGGKNTSAAH